MNDIGIERMVERVSLCVDTPELRTRYQVQCNLPHVSVASGLTVLHTNHGTGNTQTLACEKLLYHVRVMLQAMSAEKCPGTRLATYSIYTLAGKFD